MHLYRIIPIHRRSHPDLAACPRPLCLALWAGLETRIPALLTLACPLCPFCLPPLSSGRRQLLSRAAQDYALSLLEDLVMLARQRVALDVRRLQEDRIGTEDGLSVVRVAHDGTVPLPSDDTPTHAGAAEADDR